MFMFLSYSLWEFLERWTVFFTNPPYNRHNAFMLLLLIDVALSHMGLYAYGRRQATPLNESAASLERHVLSALRIEPGTNLYVLLAC